MRRQCQTTLAGACALKNEPSPVKVSGAGVSGNTYRQMIDVNSIEFYSIALLVAVALIGLIFGEKPHRPAATDIVQLVLKWPQTAVASPDEMPSAVTLTAMPDGQVRLSRTGLSLRPGDTAFIVATMVDDKLRIEEKQGVRSTMAVWPEPCEASATLGFWPAGRKLHVRYESELTGQWGTCALANVGGRESRIELKY